MKTPIEHALLKEVGSVIYGRGQSYFRQGRVSELKTDYDEDGLLRLHATVRGGSRYKTEVEYDNLAESFISIHCSCPYEYNCKHAVATVLSYMASGERVTPAPTKKGVSAPQADEVRAVLAKLGIAADTVPQQLLDTLLTYTTPTNDATPPKGKGGVVGPTKHNVPAPKQTLRVFNPSTYEVLISPTRNYSVTLHPKGRYYERISIANLLSQCALTDTQRTLLTYIKEHDVSVYSYNTPRTDLSVLFPMLAAEAIPLVCGEGYYGGSPRSVRVVLDPPPISVQLVHEVLTHPYSGDVRHEIRAVMQNERQPGRGVRRSVWSKQGSGLVHETDTQVRLYSLPQEWCEVVRRSVALYDILPPAQIPTYRYHGTTLLAKELEHIQQMCASAGEYIALDAPDAVRTLEVHTKRPKRVLSVDFDATEHVIQVSPVAEYGAWQSNLAENISRRYVGRHKYQRRMSYRHTGQYVITEVDGVLHYTRFSDKDEISFYKELEASYDVLGFTKTLKCLHRGQRKVTTYLGEYWQPLCAFAERIGCDISFVRDALPKERVSILADFSSDVDAENDWLHFDVNLYCAGEKVTLEKLYEYMESGASYWRKDDGTLVEVENHGELERLVRLLKTFRTSEEGGFEGKLHHAPELTYVMTSSPHYTATQTKSLRDFMKRVESGKPVKKVRLPTRIKSVLRPYQAAGVEWLYFLRSYHFAGILADDMGLGKTLQALTVLSLTRVEGAPSLVVCPKSLLYNWKNEAATFFPDMRVLVYDGTPSEREHLRADLTTHDLVVVGYSTLKRDKDILCGEGVRYNYAVLDEAQYIKNHMTKMAQCVKEIPADYRLALTGTPLENHVFELWSIYDYLMPGFLGKHVHFKDHYHKPIMEKGDLQALTHLKKKVESFMLRRTKEEVLTDLPPKVEQIRECVLTDAQNVLYQQILKDVRGTVFDAVASKGFKSSQIHILAGITKLRQACNHPALLTKDTDYTAYESAKLDACMELVDEVVASGRKVLIFSQFTGMLDILARVLTDRDIAYAYLSGKTKKRHEVIDRFNNDSSVPVFLISMKAGGTGLNLTVADNVIVFDPWWNPSVERQAVDRAHRIGQTRSVNVYRLITKGTIEEKMQSLKRKKQGLFDAVVEESGELFKKLTWEDIRELFAE